MRELINIDEFRKRKEQALDQTELPAIEDLKISSLIGVATGRKRLPTVTEVIDLQAERLKRAARKKGRNVFEGAGRYATNFVFGEKYGSKVYDKVYDLNAYRLVKTITDKYLSGYSEVDFQPAKYGSKELMDEKGKKLFGRFVGSKAWYVDNPEEALGENYDYILRKSGLSKEQFDWGFIEFVKTHENGEAGKLKRTLKESFGEEEHGKFQADLLRSLKYSDKPGAQEIYKVGILIDGLRRDEYGQNIRKYATKDIAADMQMAA